MAFDRSHWYTRKIQHWRRVTAHWSPEELEAHEERAVRHATRLVRQAGEKGLTQDELLELLPEAVKRDPNAAKYALSKLRARGVLATNGDMRKKMGTLQAVHVDATLVKNVPKVVGRSSQGSRRFVEGGQNHRVFEFVRAAGEVGALLRDIQTAFPDIKPNLVQSRLTELMQMGFVGRREGAYVMIAEPPPPKKRPGAMPDMVGMELTFTKYGARARCVVTNEGFEVQPGSVFPARIVESARGSIEDHRSKLIASGILQRNGDATLTLTAPALFDSLSTAASVVSGVVSNGRDDWNVGNESVKSWASRRVAA